MKDPTKRHNRCRVAQHGTGEGKVDDGNIDDGDDDDMYHLDTSIATETVILEKLRKRV